MPRAASFEEAAGIALAGSTALQALRDVARVRAGDRVLLNGASGGVGTLAIQLARVLGCRVTATCGAASMARCRELGADEVLDHAEGDLLERAGRHRVVLDIHGSLSLDRVRSALEPGGVFVTTVPSRRIFLDTLRTLAGGVRARMVSVRPRTADLATLAQLVDEGRVRPVIDRVYPLAEAVEAANHLKGGRAHGKVVVRVA
jgi:NADPH:quinone reductase-like Zn-dependent oxidoreductase